MSDEVQPDPEPLFYNGNRVEFEDPEDPRAAALAAGEDIGVDSEPEARRERKPAAAKPDAS